MNVSRSWALCKEKDARGKELPFFFFGRRLGRLLAELCQAVLEDD